MNEAKVEEIKTKISKSMHDYIDVRKLYEDKIRKNHVYKENIEEPNAKLQVLEVELVSLLQGNKTRKIAKSTLHAVQTFHSDQNLPPRTVCTRLTLADALAKVTLKIGHVVVLEHINDSARNTSTETD